MKTIVQLALEALNTGDVPMKYFDASKQRLASDENKIEDILPSSGGQDRFIEQITSEGYKLVVTKLASYLDMPIADLMRRYPNAYSFSAVVMQTLTEVMQMEASNKQMLEELALKTVFELAEFAQFKKLYDRGILKLDIKLGPPELGNAKTSDDVQDDLEEQIEEEQEDIIEEIEPLIEDNTDAKLKRVLHNYITQGNAVHKSFLFNMVNEELTAIDEKLPVKYGLIMSVVHMLYYGTPYVGGEILKSPDAGLGSAEAQEDDVIKVRGLIFPVLVHELVKGLFDYLGKDISPEGAEGETLEDEYMQLMAGPELYKKLNAVIPSGKIELLPIIYRLLMKREVEEIKQVIANSAQGKQIINALAIEAQRLADEMDQEPEEEFDADQDFDFGGGEDEGEDDDVDPYNLYGGN
jgi:hypothetical protein